MKDADDAKARAAEEKKKKEAADAAKAAAKMKEGNVRPGKDREKEEWKQATGTTEKYAEYDYRKRKYVEGGNTVVEKTLDVGEFSGDDLKEIVGKIKRLFTLLRPQDNALLKKQYEGEEIDIESYMQYLIDKRCGMNPEPRYFTQMRKDMRSVATMVLVDMSGSTENSAGNNKKIIEVEKEALYVIAKALEAIGDTFSLCGFDAVEDKDETNFYTFKSFQSTRAKIPNMYAMNENRDGAAIRHATKKLLQTSEKLKLLIVISDGEPLHGGTNYIGTYALEDTKKAIEEARKAGVKPFGIIVGNHEREEFAKMYGNDLLMVRNVTELPELLLRLYKRLTIG
ncbi:MAG: VWA domain-containing protein [Candidatus Micrarchaeia archaeon]